MEPWTISSTVKQLIIWKAQVLLWNATLVTDCREILKLHAQMEIGLQLWECASSVSVTSQSDSMCHIFF